MKHKAEMQKGRDPLTKPGWIRVFNRAYSLPDAIREFLPDVYQAIDKTKRDPYANGDGGGVVEA